MLAALLKDASAAAFVCGAGVAKSLCPTCPMWRELIDRLACRVKNVRGFNDRGLQDVSRADVGEAAAKIKIDMGFNATSADYRSLMYVVRCTVHLSRTVFESELISSDNCGMVCVVVVNSYHEFHGLEVQNRAIAIALSKFGHTPLLTVNYDTLLEDALPELRPGVARFPISHASVLSECGLESVWGTLLHGTRDTLGQLSVTHLHGFCWNRTDVDGFTLTPDEYTAEAAIEKFLQFLLPGITGVFGVPRSLVFVGCGDTLQDLHFWALWGSQLALRRAGYWSARYRKEPEHFWLVAHEEFDAKKAIAADVLNITGVTIHVVDYGRHSDLPEFISSVSGDTENTLNLDGVGATLT